MTESRAWPLIAHSVGLETTPALAVSASVRTHDSEMICQYRVTGARTDLTVPEFAEQCRLDGLWRHTCFEVFIGLKDSPEYVEFNASPSSAWALYHFVAERVRAPDWSLSAPSIQSAWDRDDLIVVACLDLRAWPSRWRSQSLCMGLSAVLEHKNGALTYHALTHPKSVPDFHDPRTRIIEMNPMLEGDLP